jgi:large subunit ribosomal protein L13
MNMILIDGNEKIMGRIAAIAAKKLLEGEKVVIVNAEKVIVSGKREVIINEFDKKVKTGGLRKGPYFPRTPDRIMRRVVRGMLPYARKSSGKTAYGNLTVYIGVPKGVDVKNSYVKPTDQWRFPLNYMNLGEVSKLLGYQGEVKQQ